MKQRKPARKPAPPRSGGRSAIRNPPGGVPGGVSPRIVLIAAAAGIVAVTLVIYAQTLPVRALDYEDSFYLVRNPYVNVPRPFERLAAVWTEPYFANFHPVTTTTWLLDKALAGPAQPLVVGPFRVMHLVYAVLGAVLVIPLLRRLGIPPIFAGVGAILFAAHPIHTEIVAWLSARKDLIALILVLLAAVSYIDARASRTPAEWRRRHLWTTLLALGAVLAKPTAVVLPVLFVAFELCAGVARGGSERLRIPLRRSVALGLLIGAIGGVLFLLFREVLLRQPAQGVWLALVPIALAGLAWVTPVRSHDLEDLQSGAEPALGLLAVPYVAYAAVAAASSAWTFWAQSAVGAIKGGLTLLPTLNLTFDAMLAYTGKAFVPAFMSATYIWNEYPAWSLAGSLGLLLVAALVAAAIRLARSEDPTLRAAAFGILWYLIAFIPVSNLVPTSTKMSDRYLFLPSVGVVITVSALASRLAARDRGRRVAVLAALAAATIGYTAWAYDRTTVWCGKTTPWKGAPHPDLSIWASAAATHPDNHSALTSLAMVYLGMDPPEAERALEYLKPALVLAEAQQSKIAGGKRLDISPLYQGLGNAYLELARSKLKDSPDPRAEAVAQAVHYLEEAARMPIGFAPSDARLYWRLAEAREEAAQVADRRSRTAPPEERPALEARRDELRRASVASLEQARGTLTAAGVSTDDVDFRGILLAPGTMLFERASAANPGDRAAHYRSALEAYESARRMLPDDPRPVFYQGLCYERLFGLTAAEERQALFASAEAAYRKALTLRVRTPEYNPHLPERALASLYNSAGRMAEALEFLKQVRRADPEYSRTSGVDRDIQTLEAALGSASHP
jgi:tetratricopeptide (TPR) repeat protein